MITAEPTATAAPGVSQDSAAADLIEKASLLINPASGIANDFLNHFNEILLLVENLPVLLPEMVDELMQWRPTTYRDYFDRSNLPGRAQALAAYDEINPSLRNAFEAMVARLNASAVAIVAEIGTHRNSAGEIDADNVAEFCATAATALRETLAQASDLVNSGAAPVCESAQSRADRLLAQ